MSAGPVTKAKPDRSKINIDDDVELKYWAKHLGVTRQVLERTIDKVGNSAALVKKELSTAHLSESGAGDLP